MFLIFLLNYRLSKKCIVVQFNRKNDLHTMRTFFIFKISLLALHLQFTIVKLICQQKIQKKNKSLLKEKHPVKLTGCIMVTLYHLLIFTRSLGLFAAKNTHKTYGVPHNILNHLLIFTRSLGLFAAKNTHKIYGVPHSILNHLLIFTRSLGLFAYAAINHNKADYVAKRCHNP